MLRKCIKIRGNYTALKQHWAGWRGGMFQRDLARIVATHYWFVCVSSRLQKLIKHVALRRLKTDRIGDLPLVDLPPRSVVIQDVELSQEERKLYDSMQRRGQLIIGRYTLSPLTSLLYSPIIPNVQTQTSKLITFSCTRTLSLPRVINFKFLPQPRQKYYITQYEELDFHSLLRWKTIMSTNCHYRAVYTRENKPRIRQSAAYLSRELSHLYEHASYKKLVGGLRKPRTSFLCRLYEQFATYISRGLCNPQLILSRTDGPYISLIHLSLKGLQNVLFELGSERVHSI